MLEAIEERVRAQGWLTISETAFPTGLPGRITRHATELLIQLGDDQARWRITGLQAAGVGVTVERRSDGNDDGPADLRTVLAALGDALNRNGVGLLITIDELQAGDINEVREFGSIFQHVSRREERPIAFIGAALPSIEDGLLAGDTATFLQRCSMHDIGPLNPGETRNAIAKPIYNRGGRIDQEGLDAAVAATSGYPFMVQLVGFHSWKAAQDTGTGITLADVSTGINEAERRIGRLVLGPMWKDLSEVDRNFLIAMTADHGESKLADIADRLGVTTSYAGVYRQRLLRAGVIAVTGKGRITFTHPATRDWILSLTAPPSE